MQTAAGSADASSSSPGRCSRTETSCENSFRTPHAICIFGYTLLDELTVPDGVALILVDVEVADMNLVGAGRVA